MLLVTSIAMHLATLVTFLSRRFALAEDQNPNNPTEQARIEASGGFVSPPPEPGLSARVWLDADFTQIGLAMARSIGDHAVSTVGVIAEPVVTDYELSTSDKFLIAASDGVWEFIDSEEVRMRESQRMKQ